MTDDVRTDPYLGTKVHIVGSRKNRPNLPSTGCPFCVGGIEASEPYEVKWIPNRWPAMQDRCEVVLYSPNHGESLGDSGVAATRRVIDLWAERTSALRNRDGVDFVLVFENRGAAVGATIDHPHGQIYAYDHVPDRPARRLAAGWQPDLATLDRRVEDVGGWTSYVPLATTYPIEITLAPRRVVSDLSSMNSESRDDLARLLTSTIKRLDGLYDTSLPYMMWLNQAPTTQDSNDPAPAWFNIEIVSPWRANGVSRFIAAAEVAANEFFHEVKPEELAAQLRTKNIQ